MTAAEVIARLGLVPLPGEGGYYRETYRSATRAASDLGPAESGVGRQAGTAIYYLLTADTYSALHRLVADEICHFYLGDPVLLTTFRSERADASSAGDVTGAADRIQEWVLGPDIAAGQRVQHLVPGGVWQGSRLLPGGQWALMGTTVCPGFEFADFVLATASDLADWEEYTALLSPLLARPS